MHRRFKTNIAGKFEFWAILVLLGIGLAGCAGVSGMGRPVQSQASSFDAAPADDHALPAGHRAGTPIGWIPMAG
jgi:predicted small secreted protein